MGYELLAAAIVAIHGAFVAFAAFGCLLALRWPLIGCLQIPAAGWAAYVEFSGKICPLTPIEQALRERAGLAAYSGDFVARYIFPMLYPEGLTREAQFAIGGLVVLVNAGMYGWLVYRRSRNLGETSGIPPQATADPDRGASAPLAPAAGQPRPIDDIHQATPSKPCRRCATGGMVRARRRMWERLLSSVTGRFPYRCRTCGWRARM